MTVYAAPKPERQPKRLPKARSRSVRSQKSDGHLFYAKGQVSLSRRAFIRRERCIVTGKRTGELVTAQPWMPATLKALCPYKARVVAAHVGSRGAGHADAGDLVPLEWMLHDWLGQLGPATFVKRLKLMPLEEIAHLYEARYRAAHANAERASVTRGGAVTE